MSPPSVAGGSNRAQILINVLGATRAATILKQLELSKGDLAAALTAAGGDVSPQDVQRAKLADKVASLTGHDVKVTSELMGHAGNASNLRDVILATGIDDLTAVFARNTAGKDSATATATITMPSPSPGKEQQQQQPKQQDPRQQATSLRRRFFVEEPTAVLHRMVLDQEITVPSTDVRAGVAQFFNNLPKYNIRRTSILAALNQPSAFDGIPVEKQPEVATTLKRLQIVQALSARPEDIPILQKANLASAFQVSSIPRASFVRALAGKLGGAEAAQQIHEHAMRVRARNDHALVTMLQTTRGTGIAAIDGGQTMEDRKKVLAKKLNDAVTAGTSPSPSPKTAVIKNSSNGPPSATAPPVIDLETLFGSLDYCECSDCQSVLSPAAYFVELLQFLRNNNLDWDKTTYPNSGVDGISNTVLEHLFARRPDLGCLELTCENTNTILPYIDLANEIMESFVVHRLSYAQDTHSPKWAIIDVHNVDGETSSELLSEPQHTNYQAYCILKDAVFPILNAPYHQPLDETRIFLNYLGTSRYSLLSTFKPPYQANSSLTAAVNQELEKQHNITIKRAAAAEYWSMTPVDYIAITRQSYWTKKFWETVKNVTSITDTEYQTNIGRKEPWQYWGYSDDKDMQSDSMSPEIGLRFVQAQLLPRSGIAYTDLVDIVQTKYINPNYPSGKDLLILDSINFSYRYLQSLVNENATDDATKYGPLAKFLYRWKPWAIKQGVLKKNLPTGETTVTFPDLCCWIKTWFGPIGQLIVLESNEVPLLPVEGYVVGLLTTGDSEETTNFQKIGWLNKDGSIVGLDGTTPLGSVMLDSTVVDPNGNDFMAAYQTEYSLLYIMDQSIDQLQNFAGLQSNQKLAIVSTKSQLLWPNSNADFTYPMQYLPTIETCNIDNVQLVHLDGSSLTDNEWDRLQIFIRLYHKLGWSIDDTDQALSGLAAPKPTPATPPSGDTLNMDDITDWSQTQDTPCQSCGESKDSCGCDQKKKTLTWCTKNCTSTGPSPALEVTPEFLEQLIAVQSLQTLSGLPLTQLLTLWTDIPTRGNPSLYSTLFLTHTITAIDPVFEADAYGNYLTDSTATLGAHVAVILAAFKLSTTGFSAVANVTDPLTLDTISQIYRYVLLGQILGARVEQLPGIIALFGPAFTNATTTLAFVNIWNTMQNAGFTFAQLNYLILNVNDPLRPIGPSLTSVLKTTKAIFDGLNSIDTQNADYTSDDLGSITADMVTAKVSQIFDTLTTSAIISVLQGTTVYSTNAPSGLEITIPASLQGVLLYQDNPTAVPPRATLTVIGILTSDANNTALNLALGNSDWATALTRLAQQAQNFFSTYLTGIFPNESEARSTLLAGDVPATTSSTPATPGTAPGKILYFMQGFVVYLRTVLSQRLIIADVSGPANISSPEMANLLLNTIIKVGSQTAMQVLGNIQNAPPTYANSWGGYLIPPTTASFTFYVNGGFTTQPPPLTINGNPVNFTHQQDDPNDVWYTDPLPMVAGTLYTFQVTGQGISNLQWLSPGSPLADIPSSALLPDYSSSLVLQVFQSAYKSDLIINGFSLSIDEITYLVANATDFAGVDFNDMTLAAWSRLAAYVSLRNAMPAMPNTLLDLFKWAKGNPNAADLVGVINSVTNWAVDDITKLIAPAHFNLQQPSLFVNEIPVALLQTAINIKTSIGIDVDLLFTWADPLSFLWDKARAIAQSIRNQVRSRYDVNTWESVAQPLFNTLRGHQRDALIAFLLVQQPLQDWGVVDADSLFEFFLIDVQMGSCLQTSRIKQAISTVQLFVERCFLNLEQTQGANSAQIDISRWQGFMSSYTIWEADREVFLWPENWLDPSVRDDKSSIYLGLEAKILQNNFNMQTAQNAMKNYLFSADQVANLEAIGLVQDQTSGVIHIFAKSRFTPWVFFYRQFNGDQTWGSWQSLGVDIMTYDNVDPTTGALIRSGSYLLPVVWNSRLLIFLPEFTKKQVTQQSGTQLQSLGSQTVSSAMAVAFWEIKMGFSEYQNGAWTTKQVTSLAISQPASSSLPQVNSYQFVPKMMTNAQTSITTIEIGVFNGSVNAIGSFQFDGSQVYVLNATSADFALTQALTTDFMYQVSSSVGTRTLYSYQDEGGPLSPLSLFSSAPMITYPGNSPQQPIFQPNNNSSSAQNFYDQFSHNLLEQTSTASDVSGIFSFFEKTITQPSDMADAFGNTQPPFGFSSDYNELQTPYALYNWEIGCYAPMTMMNKFLATQQFDQALAMASYVFDPFAPRSSPPIPGDLWHWPPFKNVLPEDALEQLFGQLQPNTPVPEGSAIDEWRDNPFEPFVVARTRRQAFMKWFAIQYISILIAYGDWYFMLNTLESLPLAIQLYVRASHIYGPRPQQIPQRGTKKVQTYNSLLDQWDGFSNAVVQLELAFPYSNQTDKPLGAVFDDKRLANIYGFATTTYFCIPSNQQLLAVGSLIDDRLYKIRHCQNINGITQQLPLFEPPINPGLLIAATAAGISLDTVLSDINAPMPNYRFNYLLQKALELCADLKSLGAQFLSGKEKIDSETLQVIRARQEVTMSNLVMQIKTQALQDANLALAAIQQQRTAVVYRMTHYLNLLGQSTDTIPDQTSDFQPLNEQITPPASSDNPMLMNTYELTEMSKASDAQSANDTIGNIEAMSQALRMYTFDIRKAILTISRHRSQHRRKGAAVGRRPRYPMGC